MKGCTGKLKERVKKKEVLITGCIMDSRSGAVVEMYHEVGLDIVMIDMEHTLLSSETILEHLRMCRALDIPSMVRVAEPSYSELNRTLDQAPDGIFVPRIRTRKEVEDLISKVKYPPLGIRGLGGSTCPAGKYMGWSNIKDQINHFNNNFVVGIQIETALANLDDILSVPGIDIAVVGNDDLSLGMGIVGELDNPKYIAAVKEIIAACNRHNVLPGIACGDPEKVRFWKDQGMRVFWSIADLPSMWAYTQKAYTDIQYFIWHKRAFVSRLPMIKQL